MDVLGKKKKKKPHREKMVVSIISELRDRVIEICCLLLMLV